MPTYPMKKQVKIVVAMMTLHNYIHWHPTHYDVDFNILDEDESYVPPGAFEYQIWNSMIKINHTILDSEAQDGVGVEEMKVLGEQITNALAIDSRECL